MLSWWCPHTKVNWRGNCRQRYLSPPLNCSLPYSKVMAELNTRPLYKKSLNLFARLVRQVSENSALASIIADDRDTSAIGPAIRHECGRFRVWAQNVGAHRSDRLSLDYRLREATRMKHLVIELLKDLITALQDGLLLHRRRLPCKFDVISGRHPFRRLSSIRCRTLAYFGHHRE